MDVEIVDVGPRDGLQNEPVTLDPAVRAELCLRLAGAGVPRIEAVSFVNPRAVPQMAGAEEVLQDIAQQVGDGPRSWRLAGLVLNERGYDRALAARVDEIRYAFPITDTFARRNQNSTVEDSIDLAGRLIGRARQDGRYIGIILSTAFGCPFEGVVPLERVLSVAERVQRHGPDELILADTIGVGVPKQVRELVRGVQTMGARVGCHFHNTRNTGFANALAAVEAGATILDASVGGTGGCPFAPRATGNIATEDLVMATNKLPQVIHQSRAYPSASSHYRATPSTAGRCRSSRISAPIPASTVSSPPPTIPRSITAYQPGG